MKIFSPCSLHRSYCWKYFLPFFLLVIFCLFSVFTITKFLCGPEIFAFLSGFLLIIPAEHDIYNIFQNSILFCVQCETLSSRIINWWVSIHSEKDLSKECKCIWYQLVEEHSFLGSNLTNLTSIKFQFDNKPIEQIWKNSHYEFKKILTIEYKLRYKR